MSILSIFEKKETKKASDNSIYNAIIESLDKMQNQYIGRVSLDIDECKPDFSERGKFNPIKKDYYSFEMLNKEEQKMILDKKHYQIVSLVTDQIEGEIKYNGRGLEHAQRTSISPVMPKLNPGCNLYYSTKIRSIFGEEAIKQYAQDIAKQGATAEIFKESVKKGIKEYHDKTLELSERAGVFESLDKLKNLQTIDTVLADLRKNIKY